jgi:hypothetical protein
MLIPFFGLLHRAEDVGNAANISEVYDPYIFMVECGGIMKLRNVGYTVQQIKNGIMYV